MLAILALVALMFVVLAVLWLANGALYLSARQKRVVALRSLAEAGLQYAYWQVVFNGASPPQTFGPTTLGQGTFTVVLSDNTSQIANTYKLVSTANISGETLTFTRVIDGNTLQAQGTIFEDLNYGGGVGRSYSTSAGSGVTGATVEVYSAAGGYLGSFTSGSSGTYMVTGLLSATSYTLRVVNSTVASTRTGYTSSLIGVQTYRTNGSTGSPVAVTDHVGGEDPSKVDAAANSTSATLTSLTAGSATPQSITTITPTANMTGVDFGYNFDTVVNKNDTGQGSLRQAITNANALSNSGLAQSGKTAGVEYLLFMLPTGSAYAGSTASYTSAFTTGIASITLASALPQVTDTLTLDATTQSGWSSAPILEINGAGAGASVYGLDVTAASCTISGLIVNRCTLAGIRLNGAATGGTVQCCYLGTNSAGTAASANQNGLQLYTANNTVGGTAAWQKCVLSGNTQRGLLIYGTSATGNTVQNCYIGTNATGAGAVGNGSDGLAINAPSNTVGGTSSSARCVIGGNAGNGIYVDTNAGAVTATANAIQGCYIGTNAAGTAALANGTAGISLGSASNVVGGTATGAGCLLSGNTQYGLLITGASASSNVVQGNYCGTNATGTGAVANGIYGIYISAGTSSQIGGTATGAGNLVSGNTTSGICLASAATGTQIQGNLIGVTLAGTAALANGGSGILISGCNSNTIGGTTAGVSNVCSGNTGDGIQVTGASSSNTILGNNFGLNQAGTAAVANGGSGININGAVNNTIGGTSAGAGNVASGNTQNGILIQGTSTGNTLQANTCGLNSAGTAAIANASAGIKLSGSSVTGNTIGGTSASAANVLSGNTVYGLALSAAASNTVQGNMIGVNAAGTSALANGSYGVALIAAATSNTIGGSAAGAKNVISGNTTYGLWIDGSSPSNIVQGNYIGLNAAGSAGIANGTGVVITNSSSNNTIGGTSAGQGNTIAYNTNQGVKLMSGTGNALYGNAIYSNGTLGIDISGDGVSANDGTKSGTLPNSGMDYPVFNVATLSGTTLAVVGYVGSAASQSTFATARVELFKSSNNASGYGGGLAYLGYLTTNASGNLCGSIAVSGLVVGDKITATATDASGNTSEFGPNFTVTIPRTPFDYAAYINTSFTNAKLVTGSASANGDLYCNGNLSLSGTTAVNGNAVASGTVSATSITGVLGTPFPAPTVVALDIAYYTGVANTYYSTSQTFGTTTVNYGSGTYTLIVVNGDLTLNGNFTITGSVTVVANGKITVNGSVIAGDASSKIAFLSNNGLTVTGGTSVNAWLYTHNAGNTANLSISVATTVTGGIAGDTMTVTNSAKAIHDPALTATIGNSMKLPGY